MHTWKNIVMLNLFGTNKKKKKITCPWNRKRKPAGWEENATGRTQVQNDKTKEILPSTKLHQRIETRERDTVLEGGSTIVQ